MDTLPNNVSLAALSAGEYKEPISHEGEFMQSRTRENDLCRIRGFRNIDPKRWRSTVNSPVEAHHEAETSSFPLKNEEVG